MMVLEMDFWKEGAFDFCEPFDDIEDPGNVIKSTYIANLFCDEPLTAPLKEKSEWMFKYLDSFLATMQRFPGLSFAAQRIRFYQLRV